MHPLLDLSRHPVIGHRGAAGLVPENTLESIARGVECGAEAIEFDVRLSSDGIPVVHHDPTLDRTTDRTGPLHALPAAELSRTDAGARFDPDGRGSFPWRGRGVGVPLVEQVLERFPTLPLLIELKIAEAAVPLRELLIRHGARERVVIASFLEEALLPFPTAAGWQTGASRHGIVPLWLRSRLWFGRPERRYSVYAVPDRHKDRVHVPSRRFVAMARAIGCPVHVWTVDAATRASELWDQGVSGIISNYPDRILAERNRRFPAEAGR